MTQWLGERTHVNAATKVEGRLVIIKWPCDFYEVRFIRIGFSTDLRRELEGSKALYNFLMEAEIGVREAEMRRLAAENFLHFANFISSSDDMTKLGMN